MNPDKAVGSRTCPSLGATVPTEVGNSSRPLFWGKNILDVPFQLRRSVWDTTEVLCQPMGFL